MATYFFLWRERKLQYNIDVKWTNVKQQNLEMQEECGEIEI